MTDPLATRLAALEPLALKCPAVRTGDADRHILFLSASDGRQRAQVVTGVGGSAAAAWRQAVARLKESGAPADWLRLDCVRAADATNWRGVRNQLARTKRNYFRLGIALDAGFDHAFLETEINANAMLYGGPSIATTCINEANFARYARLRHGVEVVDFDSDAPVWLFSTTGAFLGEDAIVHPITGLGRNAGVRDIGDWGPDLLLDVIREGSRYLAAQVHEDGRFDYGWHPCFDRPIAAYNSLRHASTVYAMLEAWEVTREPALRGAIERALGCLTSAMIRPVTLPDGAAAAFLVEDNDEAKLGGNAVCLLALTKHAELTGSADHRSLLDQLAAGILHMQDAATGRFVHVLDFPSLAVKEPFRIIYYDGEAAFGLMRLYELTGDPRLIAAVERAFDHFIAAEHWRAHDHWLGYAADALTRHRPEERYFRFGIDNVRDHLDFVERRITTFPTLLELMTAAARMIERLERDPGRRRLLDRIDLPHFRRAMHGRACYLMNGHFWPELAMFYANPARIRGSFFIRHHAFRVRIDDVEHYLSGLIAYRRHLLGEAKRDKRPAIGPAADGWTADAVADATGGRWVQPPPAGWRATGLCSHAPTLAVGDMVLARIGDEPRGVPTARLAGLPLRPAAILTTAPEAAPSDLPVLRIADGGAAMLALGTRARDAMTGRVIGVTGSAGKTTLVAMIAAALAHRGSVATTRGNANLPHGIAWNLASIAPDTAFIALELAIGRMAQNARLARPDLAVFTNIAPAHLDFHRDLATIARRKSAIFEGMVPGGIAILNRDMAEYAIVRAAALAQNLTVIDYGRSDEAAYRLFAHGGHDNEVVAETPLGLITYRLDAAGGHMALNSVAALAVAQALGVDLAEAARALSCFRSLPGRGDRHQITVGQRRVTLIDESYNANPASMVAALDLLGQERGGGRIAVLGEMLELGPEAAAFHTALAPVIGCAGIDTVHVIGNLYRSLWAELSPDQRGVFADTIESLLGRLVDSLNDGDIVLLKGSHGSKIHRLVDALIAHRRPSLRNFRAGVS